MQKILCLKKKRQKYMKAVCTFAKNRIPPQYEEDIELPNGKIKKGKIIEQSVKYIADFVYIDAKTGKTIVEDAKGYKDGGAYRIFVIKRKLMLERFGIRIKEV